MIVAVRMRVAAGEAAGARTDLLFPKPYQVAFLPGGIQSDCPISPHYIRLIPQHATCKTALTDRKRAACL